MCTLTFSPHATGYLLAMNRDEQRSRARALPPNWHRLGDRRALFPHEPGGGAWIGLNDPGNSCALLNWYSAPTRILAHPISRGVVVPALLEADGPESAGAILSRLQLGRMQPFRLVGFFQASESPIVREWRWDGTLLEAINWGWQLRHWISSAKDEVEAQRLREACFRRHETEADAGSEAWLQRMYSTHEPEAGPYSICMHRDDAMTVSHTRLEIRKDDVRMRYVDGPPCECGSPVHVAGGKCGH